MRRPAFSDFGVISRSVKSASARNMPVDSMNVTIMTSTMVTISTGSKIGMPKWNGVMNANQPASPILSKCIMPSAAVIVAPMMMPSRTAMLATKPRPNFAISRIDTKTMPAMPICDSGA